MSGNHSTTTNHNVDFLEKNFGFTKDKSRAIFTKGEKAFFSPAVAKNTQNYYWFDIREANINYIRDKGFIIEEIIIRIVPDRFIFLKWNEFATLFENPKIENNTDLSVWQFTLEDNFTKIQNRRTKKSLHVQCLSIEKIKNISYEL